MERKTVAETSPYLISGFYGDICIDMMIESLQAYKAQGFTLVEIEKEEARYPEESDSPVVVATKRRLENDEEYQRRIEEDLRNKELRRKAYLQLKEEFGE
jgi:hypothetical protein